MDLGSCNFQLESPGGRRSACTKQYLERSGASRPSRSLGVGELLYEVGVTLTELGMQGPREAILKA